MSQTLSGVLFVMVAALFWGTIGPSAKYVADMDPVTLGLLRAFAGGICFFLHALFTKQLAIAKKHIPAFVVFSILGIACFFGTYQAAIPRIGAGLASVLLYTAPAWVALLSVLFLNEKMTKIKCVSLLFCIGGAGLACYSPDGLVEFDLLGVIFGLTAGFTYSLHYLFGKTYLKDYSAITLYAWVLPLGCFFLMCFQGFPNLIEAMESSEYAVPVVLWHGLISTYAAYFLYCQGLQRLEATRVSMIATMEPIFAVFLAWLLWNENLGVYGYIGAGLVITGVIISSKQK